jgi:hypothetical protein
MIATTYDVGMPSASFVVATQIGLKNAAKPRSLKPELLPNASAKLRVSQIRALAAGEGNP